MQAAEGGTSRSGQLIVPVAIAAISFHLVIASLFFIEAPLVERLAWAVLAGLAGGAALLHAGGLSRGWCGMLTLVYGGPAVLFGLGVHASHIVQVGRRSFFGKTQAEARKKLQAAQRSLDENLPLPSERLTLSAFLTTWLEEKKKTLRPESWRRYNDLARLYVIPELGAKKLIKLSIEDVQALHGSLARRGLSGTTCQHAHGMLRTALQDALRWKRVAWNVASLVPAPRRSTGEMKHLGAIDARTLLVAAKGEPLGPFFTLALTAGLREGELQALRWKDVDLPRRRLRVTATLTTVKEGAPVFGEPKTEHSRRTVWLSDMAVDALESQHADQGARRRLAGPAWQEHGLVFTNEVGVPLWRSQVRRHWLALLKKAELPHMRVHDLRHSAASLLLAEGVPVKVVSEMLGHSDVTTTLRIYAHVIEGAQEQAASAMDRLFNA